MDNNVDNPNSLPSKDERVTKLETIYEPWMRERPSDGMIVQINFILSLVDGTLIESSRERKKEPFEFVLGSTTVIEGLNIAVRTFGRGERSKVKIASNFAYGHDGLGLLIPSNSTLICDIELVDFSERQPMWNKPLMCNV